MLCQPMKAHMPAAPHMHHICDAVQGLGQNGGLALVAMQGQISCEGDTVACARLQTPAPMRRKLALKKGKMQKKTSPKLHASICSDAAQHISLIWPSTCGMQAITLTSSCRWASEVSCG